MRLSEDCYKNAAASGVFFVLAVQVSSGWMLK